MKRLLLFSAVLLSATVAQGQTAQMTSNGSRITATEFQAQVQRELAQVPGGAELYQRCDGFSRKINYLAFRALQHPSKGADGSLAMDTLVEDDISNTPVDEDEPSIAINRRVPQLIVAGANDLVMDSLSMPAYLSTDAGITWKTYRLPLANDEGSKPWGDPMIISNNDGTFYYAFLLVDITQPNGLSDLMVAHSINGKTWTLGRPVVGNTLNSTGFEDKETIAVDNDLRSPHYGRLYIAWTEYQQDDSLASRYFAKHLLAYSDNEGGSWSKPVEFTQTYGYFALIRVGARGTVFIASMTRDDSDAGSHGMSISTDGGASFRDFHIANFANFPLNNGGRPGLKGDDGFRALPYPAFDVDSANKILAVYGSYDTNSIDAALYEVQSNNLGQSWSEPVPIGTPEGLANDHYLPWVNVDPVTQQAFISMSSSEEDLTLNIKSRAVRCGFETPGELHPMGSRLFNPTVVDAPYNNFIGDYAGSDAYDGFYAATWTENRTSKNSDGEIFAFVTSLPLSVDPSLNPSGVTRQINISQFAAGNVFPNPTSGSSVSISIASNEERNATIRIFDLKGNEVLNSIATISPDNTDPLTLDIHALPAGVYHVLISSGTDQVDRNLVILR